LSQHSSILVVWENDERPRKSDIKRRGVAMMERSETTTESLLGDTDESITSLDELREICLPTLTARIWETCCWPKRMSDGWKVGDYNFIVISFSPAGDDRAALYLQFWSEPLEPVLAEVCSGNWNPGALKYIRHPQRKALEELGFTIGGGAGNFQKEVVIRSPEEAEQAASEALSIVFDVFRYRGQVPLSIKCDHGERATHAPVHSSLTPEDFIKLALEAGFRASQLPQGDAPVIALAHGRFRSVALLGSPVPNSQLFTSVLLRSLVRDSGGRLPRQVLRRHAQLAPAKLIEDNGGKIWAQTELVFDGGVTTDWITRSLHRWRGIVRECERAMRVSAKLRSGEPTARPAPALPHRVSRPDANPRGRRINTASPRRP
jgi:hypothetical protein